jgi:hypothetical protein
MLVFDTGYKGSVPKAIGVGKPDFSWPHRI